MKNQISDEEFNKCFKMKPEEIVEYFEAKGLKPSFDWHEVYEDAHAKAFTVAKMTELDLLKDTKDLLQKSLDEGKSYSSFKKEAMELFKRKGWTGHREVIDPNTGETKLVELGTPRRIKQIYSCNMNSAYSVGRYKEMLEEADVAPYWQYKSLMDGRERPEHRALHNKVFKCSDPFWSSFFPPNGWECRCYVTNLSKREVEKQGLKVENSEGRIKDTTIKAGEELHPTKSYIFNHDGRKITMIPDAGWGTNLGAQAWGLDVQAWNKVKDLDEKIKLQFISKMAENPYREKACNNFISNVIKSGFKTTGKEIVISWISPELFKILQKNNINPKTPIIVLQEQRVGHIVFKNEAQKLSNDEYYNVYDIINNPDERYFDYSKPNQIGITYVRLLNEKDCIKVCVKLCQVKKGIPVNYISTAGKVSRHSLTLNYYKKIE